MSKYTVKELWEERYGKAEEVIDYAGRRMLKAACGDPYSSYQPTIDHIKPIATAKTEQDVIDLCHYTNLQMLKPEDNLAKSDKEGWTVNDKKGS